MTGRRAQNFTRMENEIRKNIRHILAEVTNRKKSIWKKTGEIILEMFIIVFAVSFAVFMERRREHKHEQKEVKEFLTGLRLDLRNDILEMQDDRTGYEAQAKWFLYLGKEKILNIDTVRKYDWVSWNTIQLLVNSGRYEGFKTSGKLNTIENTELRNDILDLYQETIIALTNNTAGYVRLKREFQQLIYKKRKNTGEAGDNLIEVLQDPEIRNYCLQLRFTNEPVRYYNNAISRAARIIELINLEYPEK
ncbi:MAG: hypothetical protein WDO16_23835 [Bacteroidota bacterium]